MLPGSSPRQSLALSGGRPANRELAALRPQRDSAKADGDHAPVAELSVKIIDIVERESAAAAADVKLRTNEQVKFSATFVNGMATAIFTAGVATPVLGIFVPGSPYATNLTLLGEVSGGCFLTPLALYIIVRQMLRRLRA